jgi:hypothetical protein
MLQSLPEEPGPAAITVTQQYLAGGLSLLLAQLQRAADPASVSAFEELRREAVTAPVAALGSVAARALRLGDTVCWESVSRGDSAAFRRQAAAAAELYEFMLYEFMLCAGLPEEE